MERLFLPPHIKEVDPSVPVVFLAGPIQGSIDWQSEAIKNIHEIRSDIVVASPRIIYKDNSFSYNDQVDWETFFLKRASENGATMFWLAKEKDHNCDRAYAQTSRFELGEWKVKHERDGSKLIVGIEPGFTNERYIRRRLSQDCPNVPILDNLKITCEETVRKIFS